MCCSDSPAPTPQGNKFTDVLADISQKQWDRNVSTFQPLEDQLVDSVQQYQTPGYQAKQEGKAAADVANSFNQARQQSTANNQSLGVNPGDGRNSFVERGLTLGQAGSTAAAVTSAGERAQNTAFNTLAGVSGKGDAKVGQAIGAADAGGKQYIGLQQNQLEQQKQDSSGMAGIGSMVGLGLAMFSSKKFKKGAKPFSKGLSAVRKMGVNSWKYNGKTAPPQVAGDRGTHIGPYAEDFAATTGTGDGSTINVADAAGVTMAAVKQLDRKVTRLQAQLKGALA